MLRSYSQELQAESAASKIITISYITRPFVVGRDETNDYKPMASTAVGRMERHL
jgi:hypothetical protein